MSDIEPKDVLEAGAKALFGPVHELFLKLTGPAAEEYGLMWGESARMRRTKRLVNGLVKTKRMLEGAGIEAQAVPDKLILPIFEGISQEDNEDLHTMWAALLANAASSENSGRGRPGFVAILKQMAPDEAALLWSIKRATDSDIAQAQLRAATKAQLDRVIAAHHARFMTLVRAEYEKTGKEEDSMNETHFQTSLQLLQNSGLIEFAGASVSLTVLGHIFLDAVSPPTPKP